MSLKNALTGLAMLVAAGCANSQVVEQPVQEKPAHVLKIPDSKLLIEDYKGPVSTESLDVQITNLGFTKPVLAIRSQNFNDNFYWADSDGIFELNTKGRFGDTTIGSAEELEKRLGEGANVIVSNQKISDGKVPKSARTYSLGDLYRLGEVSSNIYDSLNQISVSKGLQRALENLSDERSKKIFLNSDKLMYGVLQHLNNGIAIASQEYNKGNTSVEFKDAVARLYGAVRSDVIRDAAKKTGFKLDKATERVDFLYNPTNCDFIIKE